MTTCIWAIICTWWRMPVTACCGGRYGLWEKIKTQAECEILHQDYHLLNAANRPALGHPGRAGHARAVRSEPINRIYPFLLGDFLAEMRGDFTEDPKGETVYHDRGPCRGICGGHAGRLPRHALRRILTGGEPLDPMRLTGSRAADLTAAGR